LACKFANSYIWTDTIATSTYNRLLTHVVSMRNTCLSSLVLL
jgi:hypothetical protein